MVVEQLLAIVLIYTVEMLALVVIIAILGSYLKSRAWVCIVSGFVLIGGLRLYGLFKLPAAIMRAQMQGAMPESLNAEIWSTTILALIALGLLIVGFDILRRDMLRMKERVRILREHAERTGGPYSAPVQNEISRPREKDGGTI